MIIAEFFLELRISNDEIRLSKLRFEIIFAALPKDVDGPSLLFNQLMSNNELRSFGQLYVHFLIIIGMKT